MVDTREVDLGEDVLGSNEMHGNFGWIVIMGTKPVGTQNGGSLAFLSFCFLTTE